MIKKINIRLLLAGLCLLILAISTIMAIADIQGKLGDYKIFYNKKFIPAMINISNFIPQNEPLLVSQSHAYLNFFVSSHTVPISNRETSEKSLLYYMVKNNVTNILIYDNRYFYPPDPLFTGTELKNFYNDFRQLADYKIDNKLRLQLYRLNNDWTFEQ